MNTSIERDFDFQAAVYFENTFLINLYSFTISMEVNTESIHEQNVAMERIKYLVYEVLENSIFVHEEEKDIIKKYQDAGLKVCATPEEPYDQIVALLLMLKFNSICEDRLKVTDILFTSKLSDGVKFKENIITAQHAFEDEAWYNEPSPKLICEKNKKAGKEKIVKLQNNEWKGPGLIWKESKEKPTEIVFSIDPNK